ncbi:MAG: glycine--tRNA ligase [Candidatus Thermoplasmatota archaeon]|nr:glycine--tRNA ligase [Candidatus Thermoplasmatota archaeon]MED5274141.1 glycine--tRNA ligase [Candidatus Thermoplasmatota archaeon]
MSEEGRLERLTSMMRRRGIVLPSFEIYGGVSGLIDYGPVGARIKRRVVESWVDHWTSQGDVVEIDSPSITPKEVLVASGHVGEFNDHMSECISCEGIFRSDHLIEGRHPNPDSISGREIDDVISAEGVTCPNCGECNWNPAKPMNLMFPTTIGAMKGGREAYMRPETAQGMFMLYPSLYRHFKQKLPFGALQTGRGYRNEISPRQGMIRLREFNMAELEYFIDPQDPPMGDIGGLDTPVELVPDPEGGDLETHRISFADALERGMIKHPTVAWFLARTWDFLVGIGIDGSKIRFRQHTSTEMAHYASDCWDCEIFGEYGWIECVGIANRTCHDLESHEEHSGTNLLRGWRQYSEPVLVKREVLSPIGSVIGPIFKGKASNVSDALSRLEEIPGNLPFSIDIGEGEIVEITSEMVTRRFEEVNVHGEWFTPHVVEPAFGIDRIIWHVIDHAFNESGKEGEEYTILSLDERVTPYDVSVLPLFDKDGMDELARNLASEINSIPGIRADIDTSRSIGRRYARADEIGVPWAITVDHTSLEDRTVTVRRRDDQMQIRAPIEMVIEGIGSRSLNGMF